MHLNNNKQKIVKIMIAGHKAGNTVGWEIVMKKLTRLLFVCSLLILFGCSPLQNRINNNLNKVNYEDGIDQKEAHSIAEYYRLNNLSWVDLTGPSDGGDYWIFKLTKAQSNEQLDSPPVLILKNAWSLESAVRFDKAAY